MKKIFILGLAVTLSGTVFLTSCGDSEEPQITLTDQLLSDQAFTNAVENTLELVMIAQDNNWMVNGEEIHQLMRKSGTDGLDAGEEVQLTALLGMDVDEYTIIMTDFGVSMTSLLDKHPILYDLSPADRQDLFASVISENDELAGYMSNLYANGRACFLQDLCNLVVDLAALIGGPILCDLIAGAVPVIGPLLCGIVIDIATDLLVGICTAIPC